MNRMIHAAAAAAFCTAVAPALGATGSQTRAIDARVVRVKLDGLIDLKLRQGPVARLVISGADGLLDKATAHQQGDTLTIDTESSSLTLGRPSGGLHAELTLPQLRELVSDGLGATDISGFSGATLDLSLEGAGSIKADGNYKQVNLSLGGVGSMQLSGLNADSVRLHLPGAGYVTLSGRTGTLRADLDGLGGLDAQQCIAASVELEMAGLGNASVYAARSATLSVSGMGSVAVYGKPTQRNVSVEGLGRVSWK